jgi:uncharacterized membrane protein
MSDFGGPPRAGRGPAVIALVASLFGFAFATSSTIDYTRHLDRQIHDISCSYIPGLGETASPDNACRVAMYSPFAALYRDKYWGGVPISLFAMGAFAFFTAFALYATLAGPRAPRRAAHFLALAGVTPLLASMVMGFISATRLGTFCKTCVGIYISSTALAIAGIIALVLDRREAKNQAFYRSAPAPTGAMVAPTIVDAPAREARPTGGPLLLPGWFLSLGLFAIIPAMLYVSSLPNYATYIAGCGKLEQAAEPSGALLRITPAGATQATTLVVDPLCPTCKGFHQRLSAEGVLDQLDTTLVLFPLDSECNWMLDRPVHPGACVVSKAVLCGDRRALQVLEWAYDHQDALVAAAKSGGSAAARSMVKERWPDLDACIDSKETKLRMDKVLRYIVNNRLPVSTPQMFLGETRLCDEDTDIGLAYAVRKLAPSLRVQ